MFSPQLGLPVPWKIKWRVKKLRNVKPYFASPFHFSSTRWARPVLFEINEFVEQFHVFHLLDVLQVYPLTVPGMSFYSSWCNSLSGLCPSHLCSVGLHVGVAPAWEVLILACTNVLMLYGILNHSVVICNHM